MNEKLLEALARQTQEEVLKSFKNPKSGDLLLAINKHLEYIFYDDSKTVLEDSQEVLEVLIERLTAITMFYREQALVAGNFINAILAPKVVMEAYVKGLEEHQKVTSRLFKEAAEAGDKLQ